MLHEDAFQTCADGYVAALAVLKGKAHAQGAEGRNEGTAFPNLLPSYEVFGRLRTTILKGESLRKELPSCKYV